MKEVEVVMDNIDKSRKKQWNSLVKMVDDAEKEIAFQKSRDGDDEKRGDGVENHLGDAEAGDGEGEQKDKDGGDSLWAAGNDDKLAIEPDDLKHRLAVLEIKVNILKMEFNEFRSLADTESRLRSVEKTFRLTGKLPLD